jgi:flagellar M-ring protein FliF
MNFKLLKDKWESFSKTQKTIFIVMTVSIILATAFFVNWLTRVEYSELFTGLEPQSAGQVVDKLQDMGIQYKLTDQGTTILVPAEQVYDLRIELASTGVFAVGGVGFELFDQSKLGITDYERQLNYQRALQEELRRSIIQLEAIEQARVHLVLPEESLFIREQGQASASVVLKLAPMASLQPFQVKAIIDLVAGSVKNLEPQNVHVIDTQGQILSEGIVESSNGLLTQASNYEQKRNFEKDLEKRVTRMLQQMFGPGKIVTMVSAELDFDQKEITRIEFGNSHIRSEQTLEEQFVNRANSGVVGEENLTNFPSYPELDEGDSSGSTQESIINYELDTTQETVVYAPGKLVSLSTAVAVDGNLTEEMNDSIRQIVAAAIGFNPERGDQITVVSMDFDKSSLIEEEARMAVLSAQEQREAQIKSYISYGFRALAIIFALIVIIVLIRIIGDALRSPEPIEQPVPITQMEDELLEKPKQKDETTLKREKVKKVAQEKPKETATLLRHWMLDD